jgi:hypothetical protein
LQVNGEVKSFHSERSSLLHPTPYGWINRPHTINAFDTFDEVGPLTLDQPGNM